jgi:hypothetical protein
MEKPAWGDGWGTGAASLTKGITRDGFAVDLLIGQAAEGTLAEVLKAGVDTPVTIEVKSDKGAWKTGNVFVEYEYRGKPSGISTSEADYWAFECDGTYFIVRRHRLVALVTAAKKEGRCVYGGDHDWSRGALVPTAWFATGRNRIR